jgi:hypothetical protein
MFPPIRAFLLCQKQGSLCLTSDQAPGRAKYMMMNVLKPPVTPSLLDGPANRCVKVCRLRRRCSREPRSRPVPVDSRCSVALRHSQTDLYVTRLPIQEYG